MKTKDTEEGDVAEGKQTDCKRLYKTDNEHQKSKHTPKI